MPRNNKLGGVRRSQTITTYGPGAIIDFRSGPGLGAPISVVAGGLDTWDDRAKPPGLANPQVIHEPRLQRQLGVAGFRLPPVAPERSWKTNDASTPHLLGVRFPTWLQCPKCGRLRQVPDWEPGGPGDPTVSCPFHKEDSERVYVVPVRFIVACEAGHIDEFPWRWWAKHDPSCSSPDLRLRNEGSSGLAGLILRCASCGGRRSMEGCFSLDVLKGLRCNGRRPWLPSENEPCTSGDIRTLQRGASNTYFAATVSALDIPPWSDRIQKDIGPFWEPLAKSPPEKRGELIDLFELPTTLGMPREEVLAKINERIATLQASGTEALRWEEYLQFTHRGASMLDDSTDFEINDEEVPPELAHWIGRVVQVKRLREVRALRGFTRIRPPGEFGDEQQESRLCALAADARNWLPAIEVRGEGLFIEINATSLARWIGQGSDTIGDRVSRMARSSATFLSLPEKLVTARFTLLHTFAHLLIRQLSLECGYGASALRERLYVGDGEHEMAGILIYTATPDSDGTLGGLSRQARPAAFARTVVSAVRAARWCPSDPLCIHAAKNILQQQNAAACHSCALISETSCEFFNRFLDRATMIGTPNKAEDGFFAGFGA